MFHAQISPNPFVIKAQFNHQPLAIGPPAFPCLIFKKILFYFFLHNP